MDESFFNILIKNKIFFYKNSKSILYFYPFKSKVYLKTLYSHKYE